MEKMIQAAWETSENIPAIKKAEIAYVGRYYGYANSTQLPTKCLSKAEATALSNAGFKIVVIFQKCQKSSACFSGLEGEIAGKQALHRATQVGQPLGSAIYFAVDFNATEYDVRGAIKDYFVSVNRELGSKYQVGVYGSGLVCSYLYNAGLCTHRWVSEKMDFSGTREAIKKGHYEIRKLPTYMTEYLYSVKSNKVGSLEVDYAELGRSTDIGEFDVSSVLEK
ncbi:DUF1906 domain-containing protein [Vibrio coralliilyticus]|uniref:DUF1906 domain-containing protein n=1 Tax=Vibrio coralliilyticus TaxID=190893 RepID=UPI00240A0978|nr:DUF1906 domain-containing protein [Vibrio coralliilyticus]WFB47052.1 DUF1906 domain-containing protein [Vibrio coralliilyticus]